MSFLKKSFIVIFALVSISGFSQNKEGIIAIDTKSGHTIKVGASGFNVRIADKSWSYLHPDFRQAVHELKPGWLRYFSGTMGDAFSSATGQYDIDYAMMFDHSKSYLKGYRFTEIKGPHRVYDLYQLLGEINGKLIITVNGFSETPEMTRELARFCKNNNIEVATWQFCNEPYFYVPHRERFWWNNGYDYAAKMKPHADAIKEIFPDAFLALNNTWDGIWGFMKEINQYQKENGAYWNVFSKHSYAPHTGKKESLEDAYKRGNTKLLEATSSKAMQEIEDYTWDNVPMVITEFGVWNRPLNGIYSSIYNIEYVMRQLQHENTWYVGAHEVSSKYSPKENINSQIEKAFKEGKTLQTDSIPTGIKRELEGKAYEIFNEVTNHSDFIFKTQAATGGFKVSGLNKAKETGFFTQAYRGINGFDYLVFTNRSSESKEFQIKVDDDLLNKDVFVKFIAAENLEVQNTNIQEAVYKKGKINIPAYSVTVAKWKSKVVTKPLKPTIYNSEVTSSGIIVTWGTIENVDSYTIFYGENPNDLSNEITINDISKNTISLENLKLGATYYFKVNAKNTQGVSEFSNVAVTNNNIPETPEIFKTSRRDDTATIFWKSVSSVNGYKLKYVNAQTKEVQVVEANNVYGFRVGGLQFDIPYQFSVAAYNGLGVGEFSSPVTLVLSDKVPLSPRNVSAIRNLNGSVSVKWIEQDSILPETTYNIYRGEELHNYDKIASGVKTPFYEDKTPENKTYYYTVKAETSAGESNFYPNTATLFNVDAKYLIEITDVEKQDNGYLLKVKFKNILFDGEYSYGVKLENISYLTVEEQLVEGKNMSADSGNFEVFVPNSELVKASKYAIKAFINTNGKSLFSKQPNRSITTD
jgi:nitrogen regulatory protein PII-like uncharacterized protein